jgi:hypothetical protein
MDDDRRIRFLVAPFIFLASLAWGIVRDPNIKLTSLLPGIELKLNDLTGLATAIAGGGLALFPLGYAIGTITYVALRLLSEIACLFGWGSRSHEVHLSKTPLATVWRAIGVSGPPNRWDAFFAGVVFDHDLLRTKCEGIHKWLFRRWNAFSIAVTSITALLLSLWVGNFIGIAWRNDWHCIVFTLCAVLVLSACFAWRDTMGMLAFMVRKCQSNKVSVSGPK